GRCRVANALTGSLDRVPEPGGAPAPDSGFVPLAPKRVLDTRDPDLGGTAGMLGAGRTVSIDVGNLVPKAAAAAVLSVTATGSCVPGYMTVFDCGTLPP